MSADQYCVDKKGVTAKGPVQLNNNALKAKAFPSPDILSQIKLFRRIKYARCKKSAGQLEGPFYLRDQRKVMVVANPSTIGVPNNMANAWAQELKYNTPGDQMTVFWPKYRLAFRTSEIAEYFAEDAGMINSFKEGEMTDPQNFNPAEHWFTYQLSTTDVASERMRAWAAQTYTEAVLSSLKTGSPLKIHMISSIHAHIVENQNAKVTGKRPFDASKRRGTVGRTKTLDQVFADFIRKDRDARMNGKNSKEWKKHIEALFEFDHKIPIKHKKNEAPKPRANKPTAPPDYSKAGEHYMVVVSHMTDINSAKGSRIAYQKGGVKIVYEAFDESGESYAIDVASTHWSGFRTFWYHYVNYMISHGRLAPQQHDEYVRKLADAALQLAGQQGIHLKNDYVKAKGQGKGERGAAQPGSPSFASTVQFPSLATNQTSMGSPGGPRIYNPVPQAVAASSSTNPFPQQQQGSGFGMGGQSSVGGFSGFPQQQQQQPQQQQQQGGGFSVFPQQQQQGGGFSVFPQQQQQGGGITSPKGNNQLGQ